MRGTRLDLLVCTALCALVAAAYLPVLGHDFVSLDDHTFVVSNPMVRDGFSIEAARLAFSREHSSNWIPLTWISYAVDVSLSGEGPRPHHRSNLLLHAASACLIWLALQGLTARRHPQRCAMVAALFAVHPLHVETVAWVSERKGVLCAVFFWLAVLCWERYARAPSRARYAAVASAMALGLLSKAIAVTLPLVLLLLDLWPLRRAGEGSRRLVGEKLPLLGLSALSVAIAYWAQSHGGSLQSLEEVAPGDRLANAALSIARYLGLYLWPSGLAALHPRLDGDALAWRGPAGAAAAGVCLLTAGLWRARRRAPYLLFGWLWFLVTLSPVLGLIQIGSHSIAERYSYLPAVGLSVALVWAAGELWQRWRVRLRAPAAAPALAGALVLAACVGATRAQLPHWSDSLALWRRVVEVEPDSAIGFSQLAHVLLSRGRPDEALSHARRAVELDPDSLQARHNLGSALLQLGRTNAASVEFYRALELDPDFAPSQLASAMILHAQGRVGQATRLFGAAFTREPRLLGMPGARRAWLDSLRRELPQGQASLVKALEDHRLALRILPGENDIALDLAWLLATHPQAGPEAAAEALALAEASADAPATPRQLDVLAAAHASAGDFARAVELAEQAARGAAHEPGRAASIRQRLALYRNGQPYRAAPAR